MNEQFFLPAEILLPANQVNYEKFSVVACDQYTSQPDYWNRVREFVGDAPSACHLVFPEIDLEKEGFESRIQSINRHMSQYLEQQLFREIPNSMFYVERKLKNGAVRRGIIGAVDLEQYDYQKGSSSLIRATEGTVLERIPPRVSIRENALLELPHVMLLIDDEQNQLFEPLTKSKESYPIVYDFSLMEDSGHLEGRQIDKEGQERITATLAQFADGAAFREKYQVQDAAPLLFAVGDGNHSLATAKACYEAIKQSLPEEEAKSHPARYALVELVNLHDPSLEFEAIHRVLFGVNPNHLLAELSKQYELEPGEVEGTQCFTCVVNRKPRRISILNPDYNLTVGTLQHFLDGYLEKFGGKIDYIHGEDVVYKLCSDGETMGILLPCMEKADLFPSVILDGALPRKTFSMGEACDKRFYLEARKIK